MSPSTIDIAIAMSIVDVEVDPMGSFSTLPFVDEAPGIKMVPTRRDHFIEIFHTKQSRLVGHFKYLTQNQMFDKIELCI